MHQFRPLVNLVMIVALALSWLPITPVAAHLAPIDPRALADPFEPAGPNAPEALTWTNGRPADLVLGQPDFSSGTANTSQTTTRATYGVAVDPTTGKIFVADNGSHRVLRFDDATALLNGAAAEGVLGQADFTSRNPNRGGLVMTNTLNYPSGLYVDSAGRLWVADAGNNRVLRYDNAAAKANGANADGVLGQPDMTSNASDTTPSILYTPRDVFIDAGGRLWVADYDNNRVLRFDNAASKANGANADGVLGQANFTSGAPNRGGGVAANTLQYPASVAGTAGGALFVADVLNHRVLRFDQPVTTTYGINANGVLGQADFVSGAANRGGGVAANTLNQPYGAALDPDGRLFVADRYNYRILIFNNAVSKANGAAADNVLGQADFVSGAANRGGGIAANTLNQPLLLDYDPAMAVLWVPDNSNYRVLAYGYGVTVNYAGPGVGTVSRAPNQMLFEANSIVTLTPHANSGSALAGWSGDCAGTGNCILTLDNHKEVTATFVLATLAITKTVEDLNGAPLYPGDLLRYTIVVTNTSVVTHTNVIVTDTLPVGVQFVSATPGGYTGPNPLVWHAGSLASGAVWTADILVEVDGTVTPIGGNVAVVSSDYIGGQSTDPILPPGGGTVEPGLLIDKTAEDLNGAPLYAGDIIRYAVRVTNTAAVTMTGVIVSDTLPAGVQFVSATPGGYAGPNPLVWAVGNLASGAVWTAEILVEVDGSVTPIGGNVADVSSDQQNEQSTDPILPPGGGTVEPGLLIDKTAEDLNGAPLYVGDAIRYTIRVTNTSSAGMTGVIVTDTLPAGVQFVSATPGGYTGPNPLVWQVGNLAPGAVWTADILVEVDGSVTPIGGNVADVSSDQQNEQSVGPILPPGGGTVEPGLLINKTAEDLNGAPLYVGDAIRYTIRVTNTSSAGMTGVIVTDTLPVGVQFVSATPSGYTGPNPLVWQVGNLAPGAVWTADILVAVDGSVTPIGGNVADVSSDQQNEQSVGPILPPGGGTVEPGLLIDKTAEDLNGAPLYVGDAIRYTIRVTNTSSAGMTGVIVTDTLPAGVQFVSATPGGYTGPNPLVWQVGNLAPGAVWTADILVEVDGSVTPIGGNVADVSSDQQNEQSVGPILPPGGGTVEPGLLIDKTAEDLNGAPLYISDTIRYTIRVTNTSSAGMTGVIVTDTLPVGVQFVSATPSGYTGPNPLVWQVGNLAAGAVWTADILVEVDGSVSPIGGNFADVSSDQQNEQSVGPILPPGGGTIITNTAPQAQNDTYRVPEGVASTLDVLANDTDPENDPLTITQVSAPQHGVATTNGAVIVYTPTIGYLGTDTFTYTISDGDLQDTAQVTLTVAPVADLEISQNISATPGGYRFTIVARNLGPRPAPGAVISDTFSDILTGIVWTCVSAGGASCAPSGTGNLLNDTLSSFPAGGVVTYTVFTIQSVNEITNNTVTITPPEGVFDLYMKNNIDTRPTVYRIILPIVFKNYSP